MQQTLRRHAIVFALLSLPSTVVAKGITYDCDTAANHFSELVLPAGTGPFTVSGGVKLNALAEITKYAPLARIQIASFAPPGQSPELYAGLTLTVLPADAKKTPLGGTCNSNAELFGQRQKRRRRSAVATDEARHRSAVHTVV